MARTLSEVAGACAIVYCFKKGTCDEVARRLRGDGVNCTGRGDGGGMGVGWGLGGRGRIDVDVGVALVGEIMSLPIVERNR